MKKVLKFLPLALLLVALLALSACGRGDDYDFRIALLGHSPESILDDGSFNEGAWNGILQFVESQGLSEGQIDFFLPHAADDVVRIEMIEEIVNEWGADIIVMPGFHFVNSLYDAQDMFPDTRFVLLDATPAREGTARVEQNVVSIHYAEHESGFLAGYAAVMEGYRNLGFTGGGYIPPVQRFGNGFIQGADHAAAQLGLEYGEVTIRFTYFMAFAPQPEFAVTAASWFETGTEVIFTAAGGANFNVFSAAEGAGRSTIGVDVDQSGESPTVITSAMKGLAPSVYAMLNDHVNDTWRGGQVLTFDAAVNGVGLPMGSSRMQNFTQAQYDAIFAQVASGAVRVNGSTNRTDIVTNLVVVDAQ